MSALPPAIFLMGPTASGKTQVAVELAQRLPVELISVDSALVYRDMNIGTAKPDTATLARAPHHLINLLSPTEAYSAAAFRQDALRLMNDITQRGRIPLLVGGTMLYFRALRQGLNELPPADPEVRAALDAEIALHGIKHLHQQLAAVDAETAARLKPTDTQRIQRALEIYRITGQPMSTLINKPLTPAPCVNSTSGLPDSGLPAFGAPAGGRGLGRGSSFDESNPLPSFDKLRTGQALSHEWARGDNVLPYRLIPIALIPSDRAQLHARIATRFSNMLELGLVDELRALQTKYPLHPNLPAMRCVGYRQAWQFLAGEINEAELREKGIAATRQLAKRQLTWLRSMPDNIALDCLAHDLTEQAFNAVNSAA